MTTFFDSVRSTFGHLKQNQVDGLNVLLDATAGLPVMHRAYVLATAWHETGPTNSKLHMTPRTELGQKSYFDKYDAGTKIGKSLGNTVPGDGYRFRGRGYVQITGRRNYLKAGNATGVDLIANPDKALEPGIAARIIVDGMTRGWFTGKAMSNYTDYRNMRRVVNGVDRAEKIGEYAVAFEKALRAAGKPVQPASPPKPPPAPQPVSAPAVAPKPSHWARFVTWLGR